MPKLIKSCKKLASVVAIFHLLKSLEVIKFQRKKFGSRTLLGRNFNLFKWANPGLFFVYFQSFQTDNKFFTTINLKKYPSNIWRWDLNPQPFFEHESSSITTRPG